MLWLYTKDNNFIDFYQVFVNSKIELQNDSNTIYSFESTNANNMYPIKNIDNIICSEYTFTIRIIDQLISYINDANEQTVFSFKMNFINPSTNKYNLPIFNFKYKKVNNNRMPNLIQTSYIFYGTFKFNVYKISDNIQFIIETNPDTKIIKKYFVTTNLDLLDNYLKNN